MKNLTKLWQIWGGVAQGRLIDWIYPVGHILETTNPDYDPNLFYKSQQWERYGNGRVTVGVDENDNVFETAGLMGGEKTHLLTVDEGPNHKHGVVAHSNSGNDYSSGVLGDLSYTYSTVLKGWMGNTGASGGNKPHNNLQPYVTVYRWRRIK